jgi:hypothetical protein
MSNKPTCIAGVVVQAKQRSNQNKRRAWDHYQSLPDAPMSTDVSIGMLTAA